MTARRAPRATAVQWRAVAETLAVELAAHAYCKEHPESAPDLNCPCCDARTAYNHYLQAGGADSRSQSQGPPVAVWEIPASHDTPPTRVRPCGPEVTA